MLDLSSAAAFSISAPYVRSSLFGRCASCEPFSHGRMVLPEWLDGFNQDALPDFAHPDAGSMSCVAPSCRRPFAVFIEGDLKDNNVSFYL